MRTPPQAPHAGAVSLRQARRADLDNLRRWRNRHRHRFFHNGRISPEDQQAWFREYRRRRDDFLFVVRHRDLPVGCIGIRRTEAGWELYNVIRGRRPSGSAGCMSAALDAVIAFARKAADAPVLLKVLPDNPAAAWYARNGFRVIRRRKAFVLMRRKTAKSNAP